MSIDLAVSKLIWCDIQIQNLKKEDYMHILQFIHIEKNRRAAKVWKIQNGIYF